LPFDFGKKTEKSQPPRQLTAFHKAEDEPDHQKSAFALLSAALSLSLRRPRFTYETGERRSIAENL